MKRMVPRNKSFYMSAYFHFDLYLNNYEKEEIYSYIKFTSKNYQNRSYVDMQLFLKELFPYY